MQKTKSPSQSEIEAKWFHVDATGHRLGNIASKVAEILMDKGNTKMRSNLIPQIHVVVTNANKLDIPEKKRENKLYTRYSGYPGGLTTRTLGEVFDKYPSRVIRKAVKGMLPKGPRGNKILPHLHVFDGPEHEHDAQKPETVDINELKY